MTNMAMSVDFLSAFARLPGQQQRGWRSLRGSTTIPPPAACRTRREGSGRRLPRRHGAAHRRSVRPRRLRRRDRGRSAGHGRAGVPPAPRHLAAGQETTSSSPATATQRIYGRRRVVLGRCGIDIRGRSRHAGLGSVPMVPCSLLAWPDSASVP